jgi:hypothetical protein
MFKHQNGEGLFFFVTKEQSLNTMTAPKPEMCSTSEDETNECTCGYRLCGALSPDRRPTNEDASHQSMDPGDSPMPENLPGQISTTSSQQSPKVEFMPLDASFVQIPFKVTEDCHPDDARLPQRQHHPRRSLTSPVSTATKETLQDSMNFYKSDFLRGLSHLHKAATSPSDPPPLCALCVQR